MAAIDCKILFHFPLQIHRYFADNITWWYIYAIYAVSLQYILPYL